MYTVDIHVGDSSIHGKGVFARGPIKKGAIVWKYDPKRDLTLTPEQRERLDPEESERFRHSAYLSPWTGLWICPPKNDPSNYTNHSPENNLTVEFDKTISSEPYFVANRDIAPREELTNNYHEFDEITRQERPEWATEGGKNV